MEDAFRHLDDAARHGLELIETLRFVPAEGFRRGALHLARMARSAQALGFPFDEAAARDAMELAVRGAGAVDGGIEPDDRNPPGALRLRLVLKASGALRAAAAPLGPAPGIWHVAIAPDRLDAADPWLRHKTSRRPLYERWRAALPPGVDEMLFLNRAGALCEGTITNLFVECDGMLLTPPLRAGVLPGVLRQSLLAADRARETDLHPRDLEGNGAIFVGNSLRGLIPARLLPIDAG